jgi:tRNA(Ile2)-agmatinylcytidine synthase
MTGRWRDLFRAGDEIGYLSCVGRKSNQDLFQFAVWGGFSIYIGIDDTDSKSAMCTTYLISELMREFSEHDVIGYPRLVRLNPNIPWKTRGNGAIAIRFGKGFGKGFIIGELDGKKCLGYFKGKDVRIHNAKKRLDKIMEENAQFGDKNTNPAFIITQRKPPQLLYWKGVRSIVDLKEVKEILRNQGAVFKGYKNARGLIGAACALSWRPKDKTYEVIVYREKKRWGTKRRIDEKSVIRMDRDFSSTFNNYDYNNNEVVIAPNSPCPVLFGIRGNEPKDLPKAMNRIGTEKKDRWILFETNQGTDEHLLKKSIDRISKYQSVITSGRVRTFPRTIKGGHVFFTITNRGKIDCAAYEPTKEFRALARKLVIGDRVEVYGGVRKEPLTINIEKLRILKLVEKYEKIGNPKCPKCKKRTKSMGRDAGYRCPKCKTKIKEEYAVKRRIKRDIKEGFYEVPVCARRHLAKPLSRMR